MNDRARVERGRVEDGPAGSLPAIRPVARRPGEHAALDVHKRLRKSILSGRLAPGTLLNQVELAPRLGVSRTPLREAIRMLQEEGLVSLEPQKRVRVASFDPEHLESVYVQRILIESLAAGLTAPRASKRDVLALEELLRELRKHAGRHVERWSQANRRFHLLLVAAAGPSLLRAVEHLVDRADQYVLSTLYARQPARPFETGDAEHEAIVAAFRNRDGDAAARQLALHLAGGAVAVLDELAPSYFPQAIRAALAFVGAEARHLDREERP